MTEKRKDEMTYIATEIEHGFLTNSDAFLGRMTFKDWKQLRPIWESQINDNDYKVHPIFCTLAKAAWWNGTRFTGHIPGYE
jgi:hypothetical protein